MPFHNLLTTLLLGLSTASIVLLFSTSTAAAQRFPSQCAAYAPPAVIKGNKMFVESTGEYLPIKGINYYPRPNAGNLTSSNSVDFLTEDFRASWERDVAAFRTLGINAVRVYAVDPSKNHDGFMCALKSSGIYLIVGLAADCKDCAIQWSDPPSCYPPILRERGEYIINQFSRYENVLGFSAGNEVALSADTKLGNLPCQKKFLMDMRKYVQNCVEVGGMRHIPVGVVFADHERETKAKYYNCISSGDELEVAEFMGINAYLQCDGSATNTGQLTGYNQLLQDTLSSGLTVPVMWTEHGCLNPSFPTMNGFAAQRNWLQVDALYSPIFQDAFNGGFVFEYSTEKVYATTPFPFSGYGNGNYGIGYFSPQNCNHQDIPCEYIPKPEFQILANKYNNLTAQSSPTYDSYKPTNRIPPACPADIPPLSAFDWPTDAVSSVSQAGIQCPAFVATYCSEAPYEIPPTCSTTQLTIQKGSGSSPTAPVDRPIESNSTTTTPSEVPETDSPSSMLSAIAESDSPSMMPSTTPETDSPSTMPSAMPDATINSPLVVGAPTPRPTRFFTAMGVPTIPQPTVSESSSPGGGRAGSEAAAPSASWSLGRSGGTMSTVVVVVAAALIL